MGKGKAAAQVRHVDCEMSSIDVTAEYSLYSNLT
jgi:peptidyl-tRNA hydrolase